MVRMGASLSNDEIMELVRDCTMRSMSVGFCELEGRGGEDERILIDLVARY